MPIRGLVGLILMVAGGVAEAQMVSAPVVGPPGAATVLSGQSVTLVPSVVALQITSPLTQFYGEAVDGLAQVTANDGSAVTGTVIFYDGVRVFCTLPLTNGASCPADASVGFAAGTHVFTAAYSGDATHAAATSNAVTVVVKRDVTATSLASSANPVTAGGNVVYSAVVQGQHGSAVGAVSFLDGDALIGATTLDNAGRTSLAALMVAPGTHAITAVYEGNENSGGSSSAVVNELVESSLAASTTSIAANANPVAAGANVSFTARVATSVKTATGTVAFVEGGTVLGSASLDGSAVAVWTTSALNVGAHSIVARYSGDAAVSASLSTALIETVNYAGAGSGFMLGLSQVVVVAGGTVVIPVTFTAGASVAAKSMTASCSGLPDEASCQYAAGTVRIATAGPRDCGTATPYGMAGLPLAAPVLAGLVLLLPQKRRSWRGLLAAVGAALALGSASGCGMGNCTDLGSRPGTYAVSVGLSGMTGAQKVVLVVKP